ncbi:MAG: OmpH family outer membrane protein [Muribaculaceae bacterium]|nr:OmpH family outer membrane protein [Muribaculaceae bacterium]
MIKKLLLALVVALPLCAWAQAPKFGVVSAESIIQDMPELKEIDAKIAEASKSYETEYSKLNEELNRLYTEYQNLEKDPNTLQAIKERREAELNEKAQKAQQFLQTAQQDLQRQQAQLMQPVQEKLINAIKAVGKENGYTMIFPEGVAAYASDQVVDVTPLVRTKLGLPKASAAAPAK